MRPSSCNESKNLRAAAGAAEIVTKRNQLPAGRGRVGPKWLPAPPCRCAASLCTLLYMAISHRALLARITAEADDGAGRSTATLYLLDTEQCLAVASHKSRIALPQAVLAQLAVLLLRSCVGALLGTVDADATGRT